MEGRVRTSIGTPLPHDNTNNCGNTIRKADNIRNNCFV